MYVIAIKRDKDTDDCTDKELPLLTLLTSGKIMTMLQGICKFPIWNSKLRAITTMATVTDMLM